MHTADRSLFGRRFFIRLLLQRRFVISMTYEYMIISSYVIDRLFGGVGYFLGSFFRGIFVWDYFLGQSLFFGEIAKLNE